VFIGVYLWQRVIEVKQKFKTFDADERRWTQIVQWSSGFNLRKSAL